MNPSQTDGKDRNREVEERKKNDVLKRNNPSDKKR